MSKSEGATLEPEKAGVSVSGVVLPEEQVSASHVVQLADVPSPKLDRLITLGHDLPIALGEDAVVQAFVDGLAALVPNHAVAVVVGERGSRKTFHSEGQRVSGFSPASGEVETGKLFSHHLVERAHAFGFHLKASLAAFNACPMFTAIGDTVVTGDSSRSASTRRHRLAPGD